MGKIGSTIREITGVSKDGSHFDWPNDQIYVWKYWTGKGFDFSKPGTNSIRVQCRNTGMISWARNFTIYPLHINSCYRRCSFSD